MFIAIIRIIITGLDFSHTFRTMMFWGRKRKKRDLLGGKNKCTDSWQTIVKKSLEHLCLCSKYSGHLCSLSP